MCGVVDTCNNDSTMDRVRVLPMTERTNCSSAFLGSRTTVVFRYLDVTLNACDVVNRARVQECLAVWVRGGTCDQTTCRCCRASRVVDDSPDGHVSLGDHSG